jgi:nucleotidyltransferase AbiEii toxin of type IV toxin-antitoxin system
MGGPASGPGRPASRSGRLHSLGAHRPVPSRRRSDRLDGGRAAWLRAGRGNALVAHGVLDRPTDDVDLFSPEPGGPGAVTDAVVAALLQAGYQVVITRSPEANQGEFARLEVTQGTQMMHVDLARDWRQWPPVQLDVGPVLQLDDAVSSKTTALVTRREPRDFIDIAAVLDRYTRTELMRLTFRRDPGLRVVDFTDAVRQLDQFTPIDFDEYGFDETALDALRERFAE